MLSYFGLSEFVISTIINEMMPHLVEYFAQFILYHCILTKHSKISSRIVFIIDETIHKQKRPRFNQHCYYRAD
jgi:hypothetical protein